MRRLLVLPGVILLILLITACGALPSATGLSNGGTRTDQPQSNIQEKSPEALPTAPASTSPSNSSVPGTTQPKVVKTAQLKLTVESTEDAQQEATNMVTELGGF